MKTPAAARQLERALLIAHPAASSSPSPSSSRSLSSLRLFALFQFSLSVLFPAFLAFFLLTVPSDAWAQEPDSPQDSQALQQQVRELEERVRQLETKDDVEPNPAIEEVTKLRLDLLIPEPLTKTFTGLAPGASHIYFSKLPLSVGGYGEVHYTSVQNGPRRTNLARVNPYLGYRFSQNLVFNSGFTFQNGGTNEGRGSAQVEFAYVDFLFGERSGIRVGNVLIPFGLLNLRPEPTQYPMVNRTSVETTIVPTTWHENGVLGFGRVGSVEIQGGIVNSGDSSDFEASSWIRQGRQNGSNALAEDFSLVIRSEIVEEYSTLGLSFYYGEQGQNEAAIGRDVVLLGAVHGELTAGRFNGKAMWTEGSLSDTAQIAAVTGQQIGRRVRGGYLILSFDILPKLAPIGRAIVMEPPPPAWRQLPIFASYEYQDLNAEPATGFSRTPGLRTDIWTFGANFKPHPQVVVKADYAIQTNDAGQDDRVVEAAIGFVF